MRSSQEALPGLRSLFLDSDRTSFSILRLVDPPRDCERGLGGEVVDDTVVDLDDVSTTAPSAPFVIEACFEETLLLLEDFLLEDDPGTVAEAPPEVVFDPVALEAPEPGDPPTGLDGSCNTPPGTKATPAFRNAGGIMKNVKKEVEEPT